MSQELISIQEASDLSNKSIQTIRRAIKSKKVKFKKCKTPQGFNYLINQKSLCELYNFNIDGKKALKVEETKKEIEKEVKKETKVVEAKVEETKKIKKDFASAKDMKALADALNNMINQHSEERQNFLRLINTLNEKIFVLENQLNLLKAPDKKWYAFWK